MFGLALFCLKEKFPFISIIGGFIWVLCGIALVSEGVTSILTSSYTESTLTFAMAHIQNIFTNAIGITIAITGVGVAVVTALGK